MGPLTVQAACAALEGATADTATDAARACVAALEAAEYLPLVDCGPDSALLCVWRLTRTARPSRPVPGQGALVAGVLRNYQRLPLWLSDVAPRAMHVSRGPFALDLYADCYLALSRWVTQWNQLNP